MSGVLLLAVWIVGCKDVLETEPILDSAPPTIAAVRPPPISGGTLLVTRDGARAVVSDPERDRVVIVDLSASSMQIVALQPGDEPGRIVEDDLGRVHVATRGGGALVSIGLANGEILARRDACSNPRGLAVDRANGTLHVACASGELVSFPGDPGAGATRRLVLEPDLRDVLVRDDELLVSTFRAAELLVVNADGVVTRRSAPLYRASDSAIHFPTIDHAPRVAWRTLPMPGGGVAMVHQMQRVTAVDLAAPVESEDGELTGAVYEGFSCEERLVHGELTLFDASGNAAPIGPGTFETFSLPVDLAISGDGSRAAVIDASSGVVIEVDLRLVPVEGGACGFSSMTTQTELGPSPVAVAYWGDALLLQFREPSRLVVLRSGGEQSEIDLGGDSRADTGFELFHNISELRAASGLACASCHPEGRDDGHVWSFVNDGPRRTQSLAGTFAGTAPYHWAGDLDGLQAIVDEVFSLRMGGPMETKERVDALKSWLEHLEPVRVATSSTPESIDRGQELFESEEVGCASCHAGSSFTNNQNEAVGRGGALQVPSLVGLAARAPFMHDGCAATLLERFDPECGGDDHGHTAQLDEAELADLVAYLTSL